MLQSLKKSGAPASLSLFGVGSVLTQLCAWKTEEAIFNTLGGSQLLQIFSLKSNWCSKSTLSQAVQKRNDFDKKNIHPNSFLKVRGSFLFLCFFAC